MQRIHRGPAGESWGSQRFHSAITEDSQRSQRGLRGRKDALRTRKALTENSEDSQQLHRGLKEQPQHLHRTHRRLARVSQTRALVVSTGFDRTRDMPEAWRIQPGLWDTGWIHFALKTCVHYNVISQAPPGAHRHQTHHEELRSTSAYTCLLYTSPSPRDATLSRMPSSA